MTKKMNPAYTVTIMSYQDSPESTPVMVTAPMPETFMYDAAVQYEAAFTQGMTGNNMIDTVVRIGFSSKLITHSMTAQIWQGTTETELGLELDFQAEFDPIAEVREPIKALMRLVTVTTNSAGGLMSPGPKFDKAILEDIYNQVSNLSGSMTNTGDSSTHGNGNQNPNANASRNQSFGSVDYFKSKIKDQISIRIGKYAFFDSVVITNVQKTYESQLDAKTGLPHYAKVSLRFKPLFMVTQDDLDKIFSTPKQRTSSPAKAPSAIEGGSVDLSAQGTMNQGTPGLQMSEVSTDGSLPVPPVSNPPPVPPPTASPPFVPAQTFPVS